MLPATQGPRQKKCKPAVPHIPDPQTLTVFMDFFLKFQIIISNNALIVLNFDLAFDSLKSSVNKLNVVAVLTSAFPELLVAARCVVSGGRLTPTTTMCRSLSLLRSPPIPWPTLDCTRRPCCFLKILPTRTATRNPSQC
jgi:hypothetical protein